MVNLLQKKSCILVMNYYGAMLSLEEHKNVVYTMAFNNPFGKDYAEVNIGMVQKFIDAKKLDGKNVVDHEALKTAGLARGGKDGVRLLGKGEIKAKINFKVAGASKGAIEAVEKAGGKVEVIAADKPEHEKKAARAEANKAAKAK